jgi:transposase
VPGRCWGRPPAGVLQRSGSARLPAFRIAQRRLRSELISRRARQSNTTRLSIRPKPPQQRASGTSLTGLFGVGPVIAATIIGDVRDVSRFPGRDHFAACNGTAPIEVSSGGRKIYRLSRRGNRRINHAIHMAAVTQIRQPHSEGRAYFDKKRAEGKNPKEALRSLKRQVSDAVFTRLRADARRAAGPPGGPGRATGERLCLQRDRIAPQAPALRTSHSRVPPPHYDRRPATRHLAPRPGTAPPGAGLGIPR